MDEASEPTAARLAEIEQIAGLGHWERDLLTGAISYSAEACRIFGFPSATGAPGIEELLARVHPDDRAKLFATLRRAIKGGTPFDHCCRVRRPDGALRHIRTQGTVRRDAAGRAIRVLGTVQDVTAHKQMEAALHESRQCLRAIFHNPRIGIATADRDGVLHMANKAFQEMVEYRAAELSGMPCQLLTHPDDVAQDLIRKGEVLTGSRDGYYREKRYRRKDGRAVWVDITTSFVRDAAGEVSYGIGMVLDITARKQAESTLTASEQRFRTLAEYAPVGIFQTDSQGRTVYANRRLGEIAGSPAVGGPGDTGFASVHPDDRETVARARHTALEQGEPFQVEYRLLRSDGALTAVIEHAFPLHGDDGRLTGYIGTLTDITALHCKEIALRRAKEEADRATVAKSRLLAAASHDLRQPLQAQLLFHEMLAQQNRAAELDPILARMRTALAAQQHMLTALLDISRLDAGIVAADKRDFAVGPLIAQLAEELAPQAEQHGLELRSVACTALVHSDPALLDRILRNLLSNALKYTLQGRILLGCRHAGPNLRLQVWDTGPGIAPHQLEAIFDEFHQLGTPTDDRSPGLGLGLAIVDRLVRLLGHRIAVRSCVGKGTLFEVEVPLVRPVPE